MGRVLCREVRQSHLFHTAIAINLPDNSRHSFMSFLTGFEPTLPLPSIEKYFEFHGADERTDLDSRDGDWSPYPMQRPEQQDLLSNNLSALCSLGQIHHDISEWNKTRPDHARLGSHQDIAFRMHMFKILAKWNAQLHLGLRASPRSMAHSYYLEFVKVFCCSFQELTATCTFQDHANESRGGVAASTMPPTSPCFARYKNSNMSNSPLILVLHEIYASSTPRKAWKRCGHIGKPSRSGIARV